MMRAACLGTSALGLPALLLDSVAAPAHACEPDTTWMVAADQVTKQGPLVLTIHCDDFPCPATAPGVTLLDAQGQEHAGVPADYVVSGRSAFVRWVPDAELEEGAEYTVRCTDPNIEYDDEAVTRVVAEAPVFEPGGALFRFDVTTRAQGHLYCCGDVTSCALDDCFGALGSRTIGIAAASANAPATNAARLRKKGIAGDDIPWKAADGLLEYVFDAPSDELCVVLELWDLARDEKQELERCFTANGERLGQVELAWDHLDVCSNAPPVSDLYACLTDSGELKPDASAGGRCFTPPAMLKAWCDATASTLSLCETAREDGGTPTDDGAPEEDPGGKPGAGLCAVAPGAPASPIALVALALALLGLVGRRPRAGGRTAAIRGWRRAARVHAPSSAQVHGHPAVEREG